MYAGAACSRGQESPTPALGGSVVFSAITGEQDLRSAYGYFFTGDEGKERIEWVVGDEFKVYSPQAERAGVHAAFYSVEESFSEGTSCRAVVGSDAPLQWSTGMHTFYALHPASRYGYSAPSFEENVAVVDIPGTCQMTSSDRKYQPVNRYSYLYAVTRTMPTASEPVRLAFKPLVTVLRFALFNDTADPTYSYLSSLKLTSSQSGSYLTGKLSVTLNEDGSFTPGEITEGGNEMTLSLGSVRLQATDPIYVTLYTLPLPQTDLELELTFSNGLKRKLSLQRDGIPVTVPACCMAFFDNLSVPDGTAYVIRTTDPKDLEYGGGISTNGGILSYTERSNVRTPAPWHVEGYYSDEACTVPYDGKDAANRPAWISSMTGSGTGVTSGMNPVTIRFIEDRERAETLVEDAVEAANARISANPVGSQWTYYNITNPENWSKSTILESANCYIVNRVGYYKIPLVMGNGVVNSVVNANALTYRGGDGTSQTRFKDYMGQDIESPILTRSNVVEGFLPKPPVTAFVVWEDVDGLIEVVDDSEYTIGNGSTTLFERYGSYDWLHVHVVKAQQGNAVVAVADEDGNVIWSWHIWVTDFVPRTYPDYRTSADRDILVTAHDGAHAYEMMPRNLGWVTTGGLRVTYIYPERTAYVKIVQDNGNAWAAMAVTQPQATLTAYSDLQGYNPFFQWGRKDALHPGDGHDSVEPTFYGRYPNIASASSDAIGLDMLIRSPWTMCDFYHVNQYNLWDADQPDGAFYPDYGPVIKTVYDPSPAGYVMPPSGAFTGFTTTGNHSTSFDEFNVFDVDGDGSVTVSDWRNGWNFLTNNDRVGSVYFPAAGCRIGAASALNYNESLYWSATGRTMNTSQGLYLLSSSVISPWSSTAFNDIGASVRPVAQK